jgi:hypothetical protein
MISTRLNKWIVAIWGMSGLLGVVDLFGALRNPNGDLTHPNSQILTAGSHVLLAVGFVILYSPRLGPVPVERPGAHAGNSHRLRNHSE